MATDPFTLVHNALWSLLEDHLAFAGLVKPGNRIRFSGRGTVGDVTFTGSGLDDLTVQGQFSNLGNLDYRVEIDAEGTPDTFKFSVDGGVTWYAEGIAITGDMQNLPYGIVLTFGNTTGHTLAERWDFPCTYAPGSRDPINDGALTNDFPEVRLICTGVVPHQQHTSSSSSYVQNFQLQISAGDQRFSDSLFPVAWEIFRALNNWQYVVRTLLWNTKQYVKRLSPTSMPIGVADIDLARGIKGWSALMDIEVECFFDRGDLESGEYYGGAGYGGGGYASLQEY